MPTASQVRPRSRGIPAWPQPRPWSTQYHDDYKKRHPGSRISYRPRGHVTRQKLKQDIKTENSPTENVRPHSHQRAPECTNEYRKEEEFGYEANVQDDPDFIITGNQILLSHRGEQGELSVSAIPEDMGIDSDTEDSMEHTCIADDTPRPATPEELLRSIEAPKYPDYLARSNTPLPEPQSHWSQWPDPAEEKQRPHTSLGFLDLSKEKGKHIPLTPEPSFASGQKEYTNQGACMTYIPALKTWINANNDYQKEVVGKMLSSINRERTFHHYQPCYGGNTPKDSYTYFNPRPTNPHVANYGYYSNNGYGYSRYGSREDEGGIRGMGIKLGMREPLPSIYSKRMEGVQFNRRTKQLPKSDDYVHELSIFMTTQPRVSGHFIIHPDWVSERMGLRRSHTMFEPRKSSKEGLRYSSF